MRMSPILRDMRSAIRFIFSKLAWVGLVIFGVSIITFLLIHAIPGNPWQASTEKRALFNIVLDPAAMRQLDRQFGLNQPLWKQYTNYMFGSFDENRDFFCGAICGNLGPSLRLRGGKVTTALFSVPDGASFWQSRFGYTARLAIMAFVLTTLVGIPMGISLAIRQSSVFERVVSSFLTILLATPNFVLGILLIIIAASWLKLIKVVPQWSDPRAWVMPIVVLAAIPMVTLARLTQTAMREAMQGDYVRTARAKGLRHWRVIVAHILPNALVPIITALAPVLIELVAGSFIIEALFGFPGIGREYWQAISELDYPVIMGLTLLYSLGIVSINVLVDATYGILDPRLRNSGG